MKPDFFVISFVRTYCVIWHLLACYFYYKWSLSFPSLFRYFCSDLQSDQFTRKHYASMLTQRSCCRFGRMLTCDFPATSKPLYGHTFFLQTTDTSTPDVFCTVQMFILPLSQQHVFPDTQHDSKLGVYTEREDFYLLSQSMCHVCAQHTILQSVLINKHFTVTAYETLVKCISESVGVRQKIRT